MNNISLSEDDFFGSIISKSFDEGEVPLLSDLLKSHVVFTSDDINLYRSDLAKSIQNNPGMESEIIEKAKKDLSSLVQRKVWAVKDGKPYQTTVWVKVNENKEEIQVDSLSVGEEIGETKGMKVTKYSDKAVLISGNTYANVDTLRGIKEDIGSGAFNRKLNGWVFPSQFLDKVLSHIWSGLVGKGKEEAASAVQNQKNESLTPGDKVNVGGMEGEVTEGASTSAGTKYNVKFPDGTELKGVDEKVMEIAPETNDKKCSEIIANVAPETRAKTEKKLYGLTPIADIHNYSLEEYMGMNGLTKEDISKFIAGLNGKGDTSGTKKTTSGSGSSGRKDKSEQQGLTKRQLMSKLVYNHYQAVKQAIEAGKDVPAKALASYEDLKELNNSKRKEMSEETKRKISEALTKNKGPEVEAVKEIKPKEVEAVKESFIITDSEEIKKWQTSLAELLVEKQEVLALGEKLREKKNNSSLDKKESDDLFVAFNRSRELTRLIRVDQNRIAALQKGGKLSNLTDQTGLVHENISDFRSIDTNDIGYDIDTILTEERPPYIPEIDETTFMDKGFIVDAIRVDTDSYMVAVNGHSESGANTSTYKNYESGYKEPKYESNRNGYVMMTLDQMVLTTDYYTTKQKAKYIETANRKNQASIDSWDKMGDQQQERYYAYYGYKALPANVKSKVTESQWSAMSLAEKNETHKFAKKYNAERLKTTIEDGKMWTSFHEMHQRFVDINAKRYLKDKATGRIIKEYDLGVEVDRQYGAQSFGHRKAFDSWYDFSDKLKWKLSDIKVAREEYGSTRKQALETSYGMSNTNDMYRESEGIYVKRQNGDEISPGEAEQLVNSWKDVQKSFGPLKENAKAQNLKLSHAGNKFMFASKASGVYIPSMSAIGTTAKFGETTLGFVMGHEVAHWIDNTIGKAKGKRYATDDYESTAGKIASTFRERLNERSESAYINSTKECFARALEQYHAIESAGDGAMMIDSTYYSAKDYVSKSTYDSTIKPLIKQFLEENKQFLKSIEMSNAFANLGL